MKFTLLVLLTASVVFFDVATSRPFSVFEEIGHIIDIINPPPFDPLDHMGDDAIDEMLVYSPDYPKPDLNLCEDDPFYELRGLALENEESPNYEDSQNYEDSSNYEFQGFKLENQDSPNYEVQELNPEYYDSPNYEVQELKQEHQGSSSSEEQDYQDISSNYFIYSYPDLSDYNPDFSDYYPNLSDYYYYVSDYLPTGEP